MRLPWISGVFCKLVHGVYDLGARGDQDGEPLHQYTTALEEVITKRVDGGAAGADVMVVGSKSGRHCFRFKRGLKIQRGVEGGGLGRCNT